MSGTPLWTIWAYQTENGDEIIQKWFDDLPSSAKEDFEDHIAYLRCVENHMWKRPKFDRLGETDGLGEICARNVGQQREQYRLYGFFGPARRQFTCLYGSKKKGHQRHEIRLAGVRKKEVIDGRVKIHELRFTT